MEEQAAREKRSPGTTRDVGLRDGGAASSGGGDNGAGRDGLKRALALAEAAASVPTLGLDGPAVITPEEKQRSLARQWGIPFLDLTDCTLSEDVIKTVPTFLLKEHKVLPVALEGRTLTLAMTDPLNVRAIDEIRLVTGFAVKPALAVEEAVLEALEEFVALGLGRSEVQGMVANAVEEADGTDFDWDVSAPDDADDLSISEDEPFVVRLVNLILAVGISHGASDIHVQPEEKHLRVRYRIDGVLQDAPSHSWRYARALIARLKVMARMDIAEKRRPQDGRISFNSNGKRYDLRVSTFPGVYGEKVVMRVAEHGSRQVGLHQLGMSESRRKLFEEVIARPHGMILVTGPTGSGKTTTLYSVLARLNSPEKNIVTIEDPVERRIPGVSQGQVGSTHKSPVTFASALRSVLRQDPDIIMVGEIRDHDTALLATQASLTGHLVLSTLHTNDAPGAAPRLLDMGVEPFLVSSSLIGVLAQRLVRVLCPRCREPYQLPAESLRSLSVLAEGVVGGLTAYKARGCPACNDQGYKGRTGIFELLVVSEEVRRLIVDRAPAAAIARVAASQGMVTMLEDAVSKVCQGITSMEDALRHADVA